MNMLNEYLVTVYAADNTRLGAYTLYARNSTEVMNMWHERKGTNEYSVELKMTAAGILF